MMCPEPRSYLIFKRSIPYAQLLRSAGLSPRTASAAYMAKSRKKRSRDATAVITRSAGSTAGAKRSSYHHTLSRQ